MFNAGKLSEIMELQKLAGMENFKKLTIPQFLMREKLIDLLENRRCEASEVCGSMNNGFGAWYADHLIANDVVPVVRCKNCKQWSRNSGIAESPNGHCFCHDIETNGHDFCSCGERRDEE